MKSADKQEQILEAAVRRLSHFGVHKTTLTEIADDLSLSKQALTYYYHGKTALIAAVVSKIAGDYLADVEQLAAKEQSIEQLFIDLVDMRHRFFERYKLLFLQMNLEDLGASMDIHEAKMQVIKKEETLLIKVLQAAMEKGEVRKIDAAHTIQLMMDMQAMIIYSVKHICPFPTEEHFQQLMKKQKEVLQLMINGIMSK